MSIWPEDRIREATLALRWKRSGDGPDPGYFVDAPHEFLQLEASAASFLAHFIANHFVAGPDKFQRDLVEEELDKYSREEMVSYLEDHGCAVSSPD